MLPYYLLVLVVAVLGLISRSVSEHFEQRREEERARQARREALKAQRSRVPVGPRGLSRAATPHTDPPPADAATPRVPRWTIFDVMICLTLIAFSALRREVGTDYLQYHFLWNRIDPSNWHQTLHDSPQESGFTVLSLLLKQAGGGFHALLWATSILTVLPVYLVIKKKSLDPTVAVLLYVLLAFFVSPFNIIRQGIAVSLNFWGVSFLEGPKRSRIRFLLLNAIAISFHKTVIIAAVLQLLLWKKKPNKRFLIWLIAGALFTAEFLVRLGPVHSLLTSLNPRYDQYVNPAAQLAEVTMAGLGTYLIIASRVVLLGYSRALQARDRIAEHDRWIMFGFIGLAFLIVGTRSVVLARMDFYFSIFLILLLPNQMLRSKRRTDAVALCLAGLLYLGQYLQHYGSLIPYHSYL